MEASREGGPSDVAARREMVVGDTGEEESKG
jgi:hypothetical protein